VWAQKDLRTLPADRLYSKLAIVKRLDQGELVALEVPRRGLAGLFGKYRETAYQERDADVPERHACPFSSGRHDSVAMALDIACGIASVHHASRMLHDPRPIILGVIGDNDDAILISQVGRREGLAL
jgi:hypothetical protein